MTGIDDGRTKNKKRPDLIDFLMGHLLLGRRRGRLGIPAKDFCNSFNAGRTGTLRHVPYDCIALWKRTFRTATF